MTPTRVAILGAGGRMGSTLVRCTAKVDGVELGVALETAGHPTVGRDAGIVAQIGDLGVGVTADRARLADADALIDFTFHTAIPENVASALDHGAALVIGTTGLTPDEEQIVHHAAKQIPIVWAPNMSLGVNVLFELVRRGAQALGLDYDVEIVETHHRHKKDAPSGTALGIARHIAEGREQDLDAVACYGREGETGERPKGQIGIHALRSGDIVGDHIATFSDAGEQLILGHRATSRDTFALGALKAARWAHSQAAGLYSMRDVLGLS